MAHDEGALRLLDENVGMRWMAPSGDYMAYLPVMLERYKEWCPTPQNLLPDESVMECALDSHNFLPAWHENKVVLRGNSWHRVIPYVAQDAVQAIEGAGVLQVALAKLATDSTIAIEVWE
ncbi:hypothetical protein EG327_000318 [Venturia inaequalis]|uniref:Uncharacterized protein n=1 Tax=Venturia inaequalis TaxID=5025 RepID=A0A8H3ZFC0_VENIN|nr:hypothetical protein EG327_000318 [Venturia inaequalis]